MHRDHMHRLTGLQTTRLPRPRRDLAHHGKHGRLLGRVLNVDAAHRIAVHGRLIESGQCPLGDDLLRAQHPLRFGDRHTNRRGPHRGPENACELLVH